MAASAERRGRCRGDYPYMLDYRTRWNDNDMYDHMNNSVYNFLFDSAVNAYLMEHCGLDPPSSAQHPLVAHTTTNFFASMAYPAVAQVGVRVAKLGRSSVTYEVAVFERGVEQVKAVGEFVHVFVERATGRPHRDGMSAELRGGLERIRATEPPTRKASKI